ncbi:spore germination protein [Paenisporosarcina sp. NPDC076898]|uniref:spore germination protein n=1 Tax=unclassified Paenisporosarcina TaxID=2642018 RepID=UPI003CFE4A88
MSKPFSFFQRKRHNSETPVVPTLKTVNQVSTVLANNIQQMQTIFGDSSDVRMIHFLEKPVPFVLYYIEGLINKKQLDSSVIEPINNWQRTKGKSGKATDVIHQLDVSAEISSNQQVEDVIMSILKGQVAIFVEGLNEAFTVPLETWPSRAVEEPIAQTIVRGSREGFTETLLVNTSLIRRRLMDPTLRFKSFQVGNITKTPILVAYLESQVEQDVLQEVLKRVANVNTNKVFESGMLEELIQEKGYSPFPTFQATERPDSAAAALVEGKVLIMMEGTPFALITPTTFISFFQAAEDYYHHFDISTLTRFIRIIAFFLSISLSAIFIAVTTYHHELIPTSLLVSLAAQREGVPFPAFVEALLMEIMFEILREAGIRMPRPIGSAVSIVGAIVIGESAVAAGLVSPAIVIVVALSAISSFVSPYYAHSGAARLLRFVNMTFAATAGIFGIIFFFLGLLIHLCSRTSMGKPFFTPILSFHPDKLKDGIFRFPLWWTQTKFHRKRAHKS